MHTPRTRFLRAFAPGGAPQPAATERVLGPSSNAVDANETMWSFFAAHPREAARASEAP
jgi:poly(3-hydroxybutyrate) depolymerase